MSDKVYNALFLCTGNSARSIMAEVLLNAFRNDRFEDPSAFEETAQEKREFFDKIFRQIASRIRIFNSLPLATLDRIAIKRELDALGNQASQTSTATSQ